MLRGLGRGGHDPRLALNPDLIERVEERRFRTVVTLVDGAKYLVAESVQVVSELMLAYRQAVGPVTVCRTSV